MRISKIRTLEAEGFTICPKHKPARIAVAAADARKNGHRAPCLLNYWPRLAHLAGRLVR